MARQKSPVARTLALVGLGAVGVVAVVAAQQPDGSPGGFGVPMRAQPVSVSVDQGSSHDVATPTSTNRPSPPPVTAGDDSGAPASSTPAPSTTPPPTTPPPVGVHDDGSGSVDPSSPMPGSGAVTPEGTGDEEGYWTPEHVASAIPLDSGDVDSMVMTAVGPMSQSQLNRLSDADRRALLGTTDDPAQYPQTTPAPAATP